MSQKYMKHNPSKFRKNALRVINLVVLAVLIGSGLATVLSNSNSSLSTQSPLKQQQSPATSLSIKVSGNSLVNGSGQQIKLIGVDATGTEDACIQNAGFSWYPLTNSAAKAIAAWHVDAVRVPLNEDCWLGINGAPMAYSGSAYRTQIVNWVNDLNNNGMYVILDLHWTAPGTHVAAQQWPMADADHSIEFWQQVAQTFKNNHAVLFDLFNEPFMGNRNPTQSDWACWLSGCSYTNNCQKFTKKCSATTYQTAGEQQLVNAVRSTGATQPIEISGLDWSNDPCGLYMTGGNGGNCMLLKYLPNDPLNQLAVSSHLYYTSECHTVSCFNQDQLVVKQKLPVIIDEFGEKDCSTSFVNSVMNWADQHQISYLAWSWKTDSINSTTCIGSSVKTTNGTQMNQELLSNYDGAVNTVAPEPADIKAHFESTPWYLTGAHTPNNSTESNSIVTNSSPSWIHAHRTLVATVLLSLAGLLLIAWVMLEFRSYKRRVKIDTSKDHLDQSQPPNNE
ncbi:MAG: glycoside hydrolase family 5 protein [Candidatus Saccharimonadales bacterium]